MEFIAKEAVFLLSRIAFDLFTLACLLVFMVPKQLLKVLFPAKEEPKYKSVLITGGSVGIGACLAKKYASKGTKITLTAYSSPSLDGTISECEAAGATVSAHYIDVRNRKAMEELILKVDADEPLDLVIVNAGITARTCGLEDSHDVFETNLMGMLNTVVPAIECMKKRKKGNIILMSSLGGFAPAATLFMTPYVATKAAIKSYGEGLRAAYKPHGIDVTVVYPGFTKSRMTVKLSAQGVRFYLLWPTQKAIDFISSALQNSDTGEIAFPYPLYVVTRLMGNMPAWFREWFLPFVAFGDPFTPLDKQLREAPTKEAREKIAAGPDIVEN